jgi:repressor LexA
MLTLTKKQRRVLEYIKTYTRSRGYPPTRREMSEKFGWASSAASDSHLAALEKKGKIKRTPGVSRGIKIL